MASAAAVYSIEHVAAIHVKPRVSGHVQNQAVDLALAPNLKVQNELLMSRKSELSNKAAFRLVAEDRVG